MEKKITISYDHDADVVYLSFGEPVKAVSEEVEEGVFARYSAETEELAGLTILNFSKKFDLRPKELAIPAHR